MMETVLNMSMQFAAALVATIGFSIIFNVPRKELLFCGLNGAVGWVIYKLICMSSETPSAALAVFAAMLVITTLSRIFSYRRKMPFTIYQISATIPLVPGYGIYNTMLSMLNNENSIAVAAGIETLKVAGVIAIATITVLTVPKQFFAGK